MMHWMGLALSGGKRKPATPATPDADTPAPNAKPKTPVWDDELYCCGDICAPEPDRDDEQDGL